jgi:hypothetical protein
LVAGDLHMAEPDPSTGSCIGDGIRNHGRGALCAGLLSALRFVGTDQRLF